MTLNNSFFYIESEETENSLPKFRIRLEPSHGIFKAHFPGNPIVPGVCQIQMVTELLSRYTGKDIFLSEVKNIKFLSVLTPAGNESLDVIVKKLTSDEEKLQVSVVLAGSETQFAKISMIYSYTQL